MLWQKLLGTSGAKDVEFVSSSITHNFTVPAPADIQDGDLLVAYLYCSIFDNSLTPPSGFTVRLSVLEAAGGNASVIIATKVASSESGDYSFIVDGEEQSTIALLAYRNATDTDRLIGTELDGSTASSISPTSDGALLAFYGINEETTVSSGPSGMTQRAVITTFPSVAVYDITPNESGATGDKTITWSGGGDNSAVQMQVYKE